MSTSVEIDPRELRNVLGAFTTGVTVITTLDSTGSAHGLTANSFSSVSLDPPLVLWSQSLNSPSYPIFRDADRFAISILAEDQVHIANQFAKPAADKFAGVQTAEGIGSIPLIESCAATLECQKISSFPGGDHAIFLGLVERFHRHDVKSLAFSGGQYAVTLPHQTSLHAKSRTQESVIQELQAVRLATEAAIQLSRRYDMIVGVGVWGSHGPTMVRWEEGSEPVSRNLVTGQVLPVLKSSTGLTFAAFRNPDEVLCALIREFDQIELGAEAASGTLSQMQDTFSRIREHSIARVLGTKDFMALYGRAIDAVSVPIFGSGGNVIAALTAIAEPDGILSAESNSFLGAMQDAGVAISKALAIEGQP